METLETQTTRPDHDLLIEVNANVKSLSTTVHESLRSTSIMLQDHETRVRSLELDNSIFKGGQKSQKNSLNTLAIIGGLVSVAVVVIVFIRG